MLIIPGTWVCYPGMWTSFVKIYTRDPGIVTRKHGVISQVVGSISQECELHLLFTCFHQMGTLGWAEQIEEIKLKGSQNTFLSTLANHITTAFSVGFLATATEATRIFLQIFIYGLICPDIETFLIHAWWLTCLPSPLIFVMFGACFSSIMYVQYCLPNPDPRVPKAGLLQLILWI